MNDAPRKIRVFVVDDQPNLSALMQIYLERTGRYQVTVENRSGQALAVARKLQPEMIILDVDMPGKDGGEVANEMKADPQLRNVPILFCTSLISQSVAGKGSVVTGGKRFLAKPIDATVLIDTVDKMLAGTI